jgi:methyl-CpG-binding domain protein 4
MLNCTSRKQVEKVINHFFQKWPDPESLLTSPVQEISDVITPLGFKDRRSKLLLKMSEGYIKNNWSHASELPGIGEYASRAWEIFIKNNLGNRPPNDGALVVYWNWRKKHGY